MPEVTVSSVNNATVTLQFQSGEHLALAQNLANSISKSVDNGRLKPTNYGGGTSPERSPQNIEAVITTTGTVFLPRQAEAVVIATDPTVYGGGGAHEFVLAGSGDFTFLTDGGSGTIVAGDGNDHIVKTGDGSWDINTGAGNDTIWIDRGHNTISAGTGHNLITLASGRNDVFSQGVDTIDALAGRVTITAVGNNNPVLVDGRSGHANITFIGDGGVATVLGGDGPVTVSAIAGGYFRGGTDGYNSIVGGSGATTIFGQGSHNMLVAGSGNDLVVGGFGNDTLVAGSGFDTLTSAGHQEVFEFVRGAAAKAIITDFIDGDKVKLIGYGRDEVQNALSHERVSDGATTIRLSDNTQITFANVTNLTKWDFT